MMDGEVEVETSSMEKQVEVEAVNDMNGVNNLFPSKYTRVIFIFNLLKLIRFANVKILAWLYINPQIIK